ncbi:hypothetical protein [Sphingomonas sanguinis]|uniref:Uncharacterized protein n=1 Tax=Sphingomonas sanguinis TaxID=33051 RepID=A0A147IXE2_9SPHN|nr:hypothetical protein [Sphingomonas sanguinis]KTW00445.1 hypothetical protein SB4_06965 [Sphingomonas sanguinis]
MIEFLQDYTTKAIPPESFEVGQRVDRSEDSELYFVRLGLAGYVTENGLVDEENRPIVVGKPTTEVVTPGDNRFALGGRAGELSLGLDAPQRATSGPGKILLAGGDQQTAAAEGELERLIFELAKANAEGDDLAKELEQVRGELQTAQDDLKLVQNDLGNAQAAARAAVADKATTEAALATANGRIVELEAALAEATKPVSEQSTDDGAGAKSGKAAK